MALFYSSFSSPPITTAQRVFCGSLRVRAVAFKSVFLPIFPHFGKVFENPLLFFLCTSCVFFACRLLALWGRWRRRSTLFITSVYEKNRL